MNYFSLPTLILSIILILFLLRFILVRFLRKKYDPNDYVYLKIITDKANETGPMATEAILSSLHGMLTRHNFWNYYIKNPRDRVSFEFANFNNKVFLGVFCNKKYLKAIKSQFYAHYNNIKIIEIKDKLSMQMLNNSTFLRRHVAYANIATTDPNIYPIKRYVQFEDKLARKRVDPISGILSAISDTSFAGDNAVIQIVINPVSKKWRTKGQELMKSLSTGLFAHSERLRRIYSIAFLNMSYVSLISLLKVKTMEYFVGWIGKGRGVTTRQDEHAESRVDKDREDPMVAASSKIARPGALTSIRIIYFSKTGDFDKSKEKILSIASSFYQFNMPHLNSFVLGKVYKGSKSGFLKMRYRQITNGFIMNTEELASLWHIPEMLNEGSDLESIGFKEKKGPVDLPGVGDNVNTIGSTNFRDDDRVFGIKDGDRRKHVYIIGKTGMGKSTLLENMIHSDIIKGKGIALIDPHGDLAESIIRLIPKNRINDVVVIDPSDKQFPVAFNVFECVKKDQFELVSSGLIGVFKKMYSNSWGPRLEHILRNAILALIESDGTTLLGIPKILTDDKFRKRILRNVKNPSVLAFWKNEFSRWSENQKNESISPILNKVGQFLSSGYIRNILGQVKSTIDLRFAMDKKKILIINLSKGKIGEDNSALLGSLFITKFQIDAMGRADIKEGSRSDYYLYIDEFQNFATDSFASILSEARKYKLNLTMANQYIEQMSEDVQSAVFGNVGSIAVFQTGYDDGVVLEKQFSEEITSNDIASLPKYHAYIKILIDGMPSKVFSAVTNKPPVIIGNGFSETIIKVSRERYSKPRDKVEDKISKYLNNGSYGYSNFNNSKGNQSVSVLERLRNDISGFIEDIQKNKQRLVFT